MTAYEPLYRRLLGEDYQHLPAELRLIHERGDRLRTIGVCEVTRGGNMLAPLIAGLFRFPRSGRDIPIEVTFLRQDDREIWVRKFDGKEMRTVQRLKHTPDGVLRIEEFGLFFAYGVAQRLGGGLEDLLVGLIDGVADQPIGLGGGFFHGQRRFVGRLLNYPGGFRRRPMDLVGGQRQRLNDLRRGQPGLLHLIIVQGFTCRRHGEIGRRFFSRVGDFFCRVSFRVRQIPILGLGNPIEFKSRGVGLFGQRLQGVFGLFVKLG